MDMLAQYIAGGPGDIRNDSRFAARQRVQQARFPGVGTTGNHDFHPFTQQAALARFGAYRAQIGHHVVELRFDFAVRKEVDLLIREVDSCFHIDAQVSKCFHKLINAGRERALQRVKR